MIDVSALKKQTQEAIHRGKHSKQLQDEENTRNRLAAQRKALAEAEGIIAKIPGLCEAAATKGENSVKLAELDWSKGDYQDAHNKKDCRTLYREELAEKYQLVYDACVASGLMVKLGYDYSDGGERAWFNFIVSW